jgi:hypothetical protein
MEARQVDLDLVRQEVGRPMSESALLSRSLSRNNTRAEALLSHFCIGFVSLRLRLGTFKAQGIILTR